MKKSKAQTNLEVDALNLAIYLHTNFHFFRENLVQLTYKSELAKKIQAYLNVTKERIGENELKGIIAVQDIFHNATGGRVHLVAGITGPIGEVFQKQVLLHPIDYQDKNKCLLQAEESVSEVKPPKAGNIHIHPFLCNLRGLQPRTLLEFIRQEHGYQNELQQIADSRIFVFMGLSGQPYWRPANAEIIYNLFAQRA